MINVLNTIRKLERHAIWLEDLTHPNEIMKYGREKGIESAVYRFIGDYFGKPTIIKVGMTDSLPHLERIYRQAWYLPTWTTLPNSASGSDMRNTNEQEFGGNLDRNNIMVEIFNATGFSKKDIAQMENTLMGEHRRSHGILPAGNKRYSFAAELGSSFEVHFDES